MITADTDGTEWRESGQQADKILTMIAAVLTHRAGGQIEFDRDEWDTINAIFGGQGALLVECDGTTYTVTFGTTGSIAQGADVQ